MEGMICAIVYDSPVKGRVRWVRYVMVEQVRWSWNKIDPGMGG